MSDYEGFSDLKVGEKYDIFFENKIKKLGNPHELIHRVSGANIACFLSAGGEYETFGRMAYYKPHKPPLLTDESIGKFFCNDSYKFVHEIIGKVRREGKAYFAGYNDGHFHTFDEFGNAFNNCSLEKNGWKLTKEVE